MKRIRTFTFLTLTALLLTLTAKKSNAHCEIPCGIYEDTVRIELIKEHITTIEKSMKMIIELSKEDVPNYNQIVRWVMNKEDHANKLQEIVSQYFLHQRIKPTSPDNKEMYDKYINRLTLLHELLVYAMKAKQTTDLEYIDKLNKTINAFEESYFHTHDHE